MIKSNPCKLCGSIYHTAAFCRDRRILTARKIVKPKKPNRSKLKEDLDKLVKEFVKKRDNYTCQHCKKKVEGTNCHASHVFPVGSHSCVQFDPINLKVLCYHCHLNWWHKNPIKAGEWFTATFPDRQAYLEEQVRLNIKVSTCRLQEMTNKYRGLLK